MTSTITNPTTTTTTSTTSSSSSSSIASKIDPLILLRRAISSRSDIHLLSQSNSKVYNLSQSTKISLPVPSSSSSSSANSRISIPKNLITRYLRPGAPKNELLQPSINPQEFYDSQSLLCCYLNREKGFGAYIQEANLQGCSFISATERKAVNSFLEGKQANETSNSSNSSNNPSPNSIVNLDLVLPIYQDYLVKEIGLNELSSSIGIDDSNLINGTGTGNENSVNSSTNNGSIQASTTTTGTTATGAVGGKLNSAVPAKRERYVVDRVDQELVKRIMQLHEPRQVADRRTVLRGTKLVNFESARLLVTDRIKARREEMKSRSNGNHGGGNINSLTKPIGSSGGGGGGGTPGGGKRRPMNPIIIISPSSSALITMHNVKRFLEDAVFEPPNVARGAGSQVTATEDVIVVNHKRGYITSSSSSNQTIGLLNNESSISSSGMTNGKSHKGLNNGGGPNEKLARYFVVDGVEALSKFGEDAWDRVVCVMTTGQEWQFRPYKWSDPKELFHHVKGFFVQWTHDPPNPKLRGWNVTELRIDETKRHIDKSAAADFWRSLEAWIALHKPFVAY